MSITQTLIEVFKNGSFTLKQAYKACPNVNNESVRARLYEKLGISFKRLGRGLYTTIDKDCLLIEGDGRNLGMIESNSIDCIITDHPWSDKKSNKGGNRNFAEYEVFEYSLNDFKEKARVLKDGSFLCECIPAENENNYEYLYHLKKMAEEAGLLYYAKVPWIKGTFVSNTGRKAKNSEDIIIFSKGKARNLRLDAKKTKQTGKEYYMSGTNKMLPTAFNVQAVSNKNKIQTSEKPVLLFEQLLSYVTKENEVVIDQFAGSGSVGMACINTHRKCILFEKSKEAVTNIVNRLNLHMILPQE